MALTDPFVDDIGVLVGQSMHQVFRAVARTPAGATIPLTVGSFTLTWDDTRAPRVTADLGIAVPDRNTLEQLDPRSGARVQVTAGYVLPGGDEDAHQVADLGIRSRTVNRPDDTCALSCASDEALLIDASPAWGLSVSQPTPTQAIQTLVNAYLNPDPTWVTNTTDTTPVALTDISDVFGACNDLADQMAAKVFDNGDRVWHIETVPTAAASTAAAILKVGPGGTVTAYEAGVSRDEWANRVQLRYQWTDASSNTKTIIGEAFVNGGTYGITNAGNRTYTESRDVPATKAQADKAASGMLQRMLSRGRSHTVTAVACWWLRPGHTVTITLRDGAQERHLVSAVTFNSDGSMQLITRVPDIYTPY